MATCAQKWSPVLGMALALSLPAVASAGDNKERTQILHSELVISASGHLRRDASNVDTGGKTTEDHRFRIKLERGRKKCKRGDPRGKVDKIVAMLDDVVVAELTDFGNCWQKTTLFLPAGVEPHGKELVIQAKGEPGGVVQVWLHAYPGSASAMADSAARAIPKIRRGYEFEVLPRAKITVGAMGKVNKEIGPFDITAFDLTKNRYMVVTHIPAAYGKDCDASKPLKQHKVRQVKIWLNGKLEGTTEVVNECPMTFKGGFTSNVKPMGNTLKVEAKGKAGGWFEVSLHGQAK